MPTIPAGSFSLVGADGPTLARTYPSDNQNAAASIPVYVVGTQSLDYDPPKTQDNVAGAIPINLTSLDVFPNAIPIRIVAGTGTSWRSYQGNDANAIPVFYSDRYDFIRVEMQELQVSRAPGSRAVTIAGRTPSRT